ncbi:S-adenosyl-L-methionine-dependent methyltransferase [Viridothelium virens]|uniref:S-adenosyl-L-methionine-dependent methyltransferase n=1 Tax=Viridothelium virens TaxID=1048519 RepID=A0A6A6HDJ1_VIRVR|nr:S-adenosyl-L-methionine-dependent methyltransferase [Viridothelium virens]
MATSLDSKIDSLAAQIQSLTAEVQNDDAARKKLLGTTMAAMGQLETPLETVWKIIMSPHAPSALMSLIKLGVIEHLAKAPAPMSSAELSKATGGDQVLIVRLCRPLLPQGIIAEVDAELYAATPITKLLTDPVIVGGYTFMFSCPSHTLTQMPQYLQDNGWKNVNGYPGPFQAAKSTKLTMWPWLCEHPDLLNHFAKFMGGQRMMRIDWFNFLPIAEMMLNGAKKNSEAVLMVDVGGGEGHDIEKFHKAFPDAPGQLVLQDLPDVIGMIKDLHPAVRRMPHDFFQEQPVTGARVYYLRSIMHDWGDDDCVKILRRIADAMTSGYSKVFLNEFILPAKDVPMYPSLLDINMMCILNGMERTEKQWIELLAKAGLRVVRFHTVQNVENEGLIEAELM